jgi:excinuclease ABC subunit B
MRRSILNKLSSKIVRPTGLVDPELAIREVTETGQYPGQIADFINEAEIVIKRGGRALATTLTKQMAEEVFRHLSPQARARESRVSSL